MAGLSCYRFGALLWRSPVVDGFSCFSKMSSSVKKNSFCVDIAEWNKISTYFQVCERKLGLAEELEIATVSKVIMSGVLIIVCTIHILKVTCADCITELSKKVWHFLDSILILYESCFLRSHTCYLNNLWFFHRKQLSLLHIS